MPGWTGPSCGPTCGPGSLYGALHRLAAEGLIEALRTEQSGHLPARTVYAITAEGRRELRVLRAEALQEAGLRPDPVDLALAMSSDLDDDALRGYLEDRIRVLSRPGGSVRPSPGPGSGRTRP